MTDKTAAENQMDAEIEALIKILKILSPFKPNEREKILRGAAAYLRVLIPEDK